MKYEPYRTLESVPDLSFFRFVSKGPRGRIEKEIRFAELPDSGMYSVHMGDIKPNGEFDPSVVSNNGDRNKVLATVIVAIEIYTKEYPERPILIGGFNEQRARLFRIAIGVNFERISRIFSVLKVHEGRFLPFTQNTPGTVIHLKRRKLSKGSICEVPVCVLTNDEEATKMRENYLREKEEITRMWTQKMEKLTQPSEDRVNSIDEMNEQGIG